jgi:hypothetical protein
VVRDVGARLAALLPGEGFTVRQLPLFALGALWSNVSTDFLNQDRLHRFQAIQIDSIMVATLWTPLLCALVVPVLWRIVRSPQPRTLAPSSQLSVSDPPA